MGLHPLEFADCLTDSPFFREKLHEHERELERTSKAIKTLIADGKDLITAAKNLSKAQKTFSANLKEFKFECIGNQQTDDELVIADSLQEFGRMIEMIEDVRDNVFEQASKHFIDSLETFRKKHIGSAKDGKKNFDRQSNKFCQSLERHLNLKTKINDNQLQDADASVEMEKRHFYQASMKYVLQLQEVQERKKFEFVEVLLSFMYSWLTFYHQGHEVFRDFKPYTTELQLRLQKTRENFNSTREEAEQLMMKMLEVRGSNQKSSDQTGDFSGITRQGYLYIFEKKALNLTSNWTKHFCQYYKANKSLVLTPYTQTAAKPVVSEKLVLKSCVRRASDSIEKRFCFEITVSERTSPILVQALSEDDRREWLDAMDGKEPVYTVPANAVNNPDDTSLDDIGFNFMKKCISTIENRGLDEQGLYRVVGVNSKVNKLTAMGLDRRKQDKLNMDDSQWEVKTITSAVKSYLRNLPEPLMTFKLHGAFIAAAKQESKTLRMHDIHALIHKLPDTNFRMLDLLINHLCRISDHSQSNLMTVANIGVCFGPTLMRPEQETVAAIMDIKFCNIVVEILIRDYNKIFKTKPDSYDGPEIRTAPNKMRAPVNRQIKSQAPIPNNHNSVHNLSQFHNNAINTHHNSSSNSPSIPAQLPSNIAHIYANQSTLQQQTQAYQPNDPVGSKIKQRPPGIYLQNSETQSNTSGSSDSLNSSHLHGMNNMSASTTQIEVPRRGYTVHQPYNNSPNLLNRNYPQTNDGPSFKPVQRIDHLLREIDETTKDSEPPIHVPYQRHNTPSPRPYQHHQRTSSMASVGSASSEGGSKPGRKTVRTLYACTAENDSELSFEPNIMIYNVRPSKEPNWLEGTLKGKTGLIPSNYVEFLE